MGDLYRKAHEKPTLIEEQVTVTLGPMHPAVWAVIQTMVQLGSASGGLGQKAKEAIAKAQVVKGRVGIMAADLANVMGSYDVDKVTAKLKAFFKEPDGEEEANPHV